MRIVILGFMGSGKSSVGKLLASELSLDFADLDESIEIREGKTIGQIFALHGEKIFREKEREILEKLLMKDNMVVAVGGGTPCFFDNMKLINQKSFSIYINVSVRELHKRLLPEANNRKRPLIKNLSSTGMLRFIKESLAKRKEFYLRADYVLRAGEKTTKGMVKEIIPIVKFL